MKKKLAKCPNCGHNLFVGRQQVRMAIVVDGYGVFAGRVSMDCAADIYDSSDPYGPFICQKCKYEYETMPIEIDDGVDPEAEKVKEVMAILEKHDADDIVHELCSHEATSINNAGPQEQAKFVLQQYCGDMNAIRSQYGG